MSSVCVAHSFHGPFELSQLNSNCNFKAPNNRPPQPGAGGRSANTKHLLDRSHHNAPLRLRLRQRANKGPPARPHSALDRAGLCQRANSIRSNSIALGPSAAGRDDKTMAGAIDQFPRRRAESISLPIISIGCPRPPQRASRQATGAKLLVQLVLNTARRPVAAAIVANEQRPEMSQPPSMHTIIHSLIHSFTQAHCA